MRDHRERVTGKCEKATADGLRAQARILGPRGKVKWEGGLNEMRKGRFVDRAWDDEGDGCDPDGQEETP